MNLKELQNRPVEVKVLSSTLSTYEGAKAMIGDICEVGITYHHNNTRVVYNKGKTDYYIFNESDLQVMTPLSFNGVRIGIGDMVNHKGDMVNQKVVYGYHWFNGEWALYTVKDNDHETGCWLYHKHEIAFHTPLDSTNTQTDEELLAEIERRGLLVDGKVLI